MYTADLPSNRPGFAGMLGQTESFMEHAGIVAPAEGSMSQTVIGFEGISMPAYVCANADGAGPGIIRPWVGAPLNEKKDFLTADLYLGVADHGPNGRIMTLGLRNFSLKHNRRRVFVGRPISENNNFGADMLYEAYASMTVRALVLGEKALSNEVIVEDVDGNMSELHMQTRETQLHRKAAFLLGSTCLLAAQRTGKPARAVVV